MSDSAPHRTPALQGWQRTNVVAAATCLREQITRSPGEPKLRAAYDGLLDLLDPSRILARRQREMADARQAAASLKSERRTNERRYTDRRRANMGAGPGGERRRSDRRGGDRRQR